MRAGVPAGGQFAAIAHPEAGVDLELRFENGWLQLKDHTPEDLAHTITLEMAQVHSRDSHAAATVESAILLAWYAHDGPALGDAAGDNPGEIELLERSTSVGGRLSLVDGLSEGSLPGTGSGARVPRSRTGGQKPKLAPPGADADRRGYG